MLIRMDRTIDNNANIVNRDHNDKQIMAIIIMVIRMSIMRIMLILTRVIILMMITRRILIIVYSGID